jgi:protein-tyrosine-phosphatase
VMKILFVCTGNTCRSPLAEAIARRMLSELGKDKVSVCERGDECVGRLAGIGRSNLIGVERGLDLSEPPVASTDSRNDRGE